ncbi:MAG: transcriptional regulator [Candidatus Kariarchaeaceae archaeon]
MASDKLVGFILIILSLVAIAAELIFGLLGQIFFDPEVAIYAIAIPVFVGVFGVFIILAWIGWTMMTTPPPEQFNFDEEVDLDTEEEVTE